MVSRRNLEESIDNPAPAESSLADALRNLADVLQRCSGTLRETHDQVAPQLDELERLVLQADTDAGTLTDPDSSQAHSRDNNRSWFSSYDKRSLGRPQGRGSA